MKVWLAWSGEYSDKCVIAVCSFSVSYLAVKVVKFLWYLVSNG